jgi:hypothetical protein
MFQVRLTSVNLQGTLMPEIFPLRLTQISIGCDWAPTLEGVAIDVAAAKIARSTGRDCLINASIVVPSRSSGIRIDPSEPSLDSLSITGSTG